MRLTNKSQSLCKACKLACIRGFAKALALCEACFALHSHATACMIACNHMQVPASLLASKALACECMHSLACECKLMHAIACNCLRMQAHSCMNACKCMQRPASLLASKAFAMHFAMHLCMIVIVRNCIRLCVTNFNF